MKKYYKAGPKEKVSSMSKKIITLASQVLLVIFDRALSISQT